MSLLRALAPARPPLTAPPFATIALAAGLAVAAAWALVTLPSSMAIPIVLGGSAAITGWLLFPDAPAYALLILAPYTIAFNAGPLNGVFLQDVILGVLGIAVGSGILAGVQRETRFRTRLGLALIIMWFLLAIWNAYTYRFGVANHWLMSSETKNIWYTYRQIWRCMLPFPIVAISGVDDPSVDQDRFRAWEKLSDVRCDVHSLPGSHFFAFEESRVAAAKLIDDAVYDYFPR